MAKSMRVMSFMVVRRIRQSGRAPLENDGTMLGVRTSYCGCRRKGSKYRGAQPWRRLGREDSLSFTTHRGPMDSRGKAADNGSEMGRGRGGGMGLRPQQRDEDDALGAMIPPVA